MKLVTSKNRSLNGCPLGYCSDLKCPPSPCGRGLGGGGNCHEGTPLQLHPPLNPLPSSAVLYPYLFLAPEIWDAGGGCPRSVIITFQISVISSSLCKPCQGISLGSGLQVANSCTSLGSCQLGSLTPLILLWRFQPILLYCDLFSQYSSFASRSSKIIGFGR